MYKEFTINGNRKWLNLLQKLIKKYNNKYHSTIKTTPTDASKNPEKIRNIIQENNFYNENNLEKKNPKFKVGERVRIFKWKNKFEKGYIGYWTNEIFKIKEVLKTFPTNYIIEDLEGEEIIGKFYENELQKTVF